MKRFVQLIVVAVISVLGAILIAKGMIGCDSPKPSEEQVVTDEIPSEPTPEAGTNPVKDRQRFIEEARALLADSTLSWVDRARNSENSVAFLDACHQLGRVENLRKVIDKMRTLDLGASDVGMGVDQAEAYYRQQCIVVAGKLFKAVQTPRRTRLATTACDGDRPYFANSMSVMNDVVELLKKADAKLTAIGTSPERMRQILLQDVRLQIVEERQGDPNSMVWTIKEAIEFWGFSADELGITAEETKQAREARG